MNDSKELTWQALAAANILEAGMRRGRLGTRKSRAGCKTCKARRLKCDQSRPICQRCIDSGKDCQGYIDPPSPRLPKKKSNTLVGLRLAQSMGLEDSDRRVFDYFLSWTAPRLAGFLDRDFWCCQVLQIAQTEPVVRNAILSMSLLYEHPQFLGSFQNRTLASSHEDLMPGSWLQSDVRSIGDGDSGYSEARPTVAILKEDKHHASALRYYNRSIIALKERMVAGEATPSLALLSCVLFIAIETMRGNAFAALALFKSGAGLLRQLGSDKVSREGGLLLNLRHRIGRLSLLAAFSGHPEQLDGDDDGSPVDTTLPFTSLADARDSLFKILFEVHAFLRAAEYRADLQPKMTHTDSPNDTKAWSYSTEMSLAARSLPVASLIASPASSFGEDPKARVTRLYYRCRDAANSATSHTLEESVHPTFLPHALDPCLVERQELYTNQLQQWHINFMRLNETSNEASSSLLLHYYVYRIWLSVRLDPFETAYDRHQPDFERILRLAEKSIGCKAERQTYSSESSLLAPLYFTATKCRVPSMRRRAIDLINRAPQKECTFEASSCAEIAMRLIAIEEAGLFPHDSGILSSYFDDAILPPDSSRIRFFEIRTNRPLERHELRVTRYTYQEDGGWIKSFADFPF